MKTKSALLVLFFCSAMILTACDNDDNYTPEDVVVNAFKSKYPDAKRVEWETKSGYKVADFHYNAKETEAWFEIDGQWVMTETDILYNELPQAVQASFKASVYADWRVDDVDKLERSNAEVVYVIEVEQGNKEYDLFYAEDGTLIKEVIENVGGKHEPLVIPSTVLEEINRMYPNATFLDFEREGSYVEIDIRDGKIHKEILFDSNFEWISTKWEIRRADVPEIVMAALRNTEYANYKIDDIEVLEKPNGLFYQFELESGNKEVYLTIQSDGTVQ